MDQVASKACRYKWIFRNNSDQMVIQDGNGASAASGTSGSSGTMLVQQVIQEQMD